MGIALRHVVKFPANVLGTRGINLVKQNGQYTFKLDYGALNPTASVDPNSLIAYQNPVTGEMGVTTVTAATNSNLNLLSIANADTDIDKLGYWSGENSYTLTDLTSFSRTILGSPDATAFKTALGLASAFSGPASATDNAILRFDGTTGKLGKNSSASIDDNGVVSAAGAILDTAANSLDQGLVTSHSGTGSPGARFDFNLFTVTADDIATGGSDETVSVHRLVHSFGGPNAQGARETLRVETLLTAATNSANPNRNYVSARFDAQASADDGGSLPSTPQGALFALNPVAKLNSGATGWLELNGGEVDVGIDTGASSARRIGWSLCSFGVSLGSQFDAALNIGAFSSSVGWGSGINFSNGNGGNPIDSGGTLISATGSWSVANGIELSTLDITGNLIRGKGLVTIMGATSGQVAIGVGDTPNAYVFSLPDGPGTAGQPLLSGGGSDLQTYGTLGVAAGGTGDTGTAWTTFSPSVAAGSGSFTSVSASGHYKTVGKTAFITIRVDVTTIGSAASYFTVGLPFTAASYCSLSALNPSANTGMVASVSNGGTSLTVTNYNNTSIGVTTGQFVVISGVVEIQ